MEVLIIMWKIRLYIYGSSSHLRLAHVKLRKHICISNRHSYYIVRYSCCECTWLNFVYNKVC